MSHNSVDIVDFVLYAIYPTIAFFVIGFTTKKAGIKPLYTYIMQSAICFAFSVAYFVLVPLGGAQGLAIILALFGGLLFFMARKQKLHPEEQSV